jgi:phosphoribosylformimino-5-aminoimidazole carboxamide ribotide isomerase
MRLIPVIDLLDGRAVHAVGGDRLHYKPVKSVLCDTPEPLTLARAYRDRLGLNQVYIADLNAIQGAHQINHYEMIAALVRKEGMNIVLDAGTSDIASTRHWLNLGVHKVVIGTETLHTRNSLRYLPARVDRDRLILSLDLIAGKILSQCSALTAMSPLEVLDHVQSSGWREIILLDLRRVGGGDGANHSLAAEMRIHFPDLCFLVGGGIAKPEELIELESLGVAGVLLATALHRGIITARHISALGKNPV